MTDQDGVAEAPELECLRCHSCCHADAPRGLPRNQSPHLLFPRRSRDFTESPRIMGPLQSSVSFPHEVSTALPVFLQCPWIPDLYSGSHFSTALPMVLQCPRIQGLYTALHFPGRFSRAFAVSPDSGPVQRFQLFHGAAQGFAVSPDSGPLQRFPLSRAFPRAFAVSPGSGPLHRFPLYYDPLCTGGCRGW